MSDKETRDSDLNNLTKCDLIAGEACEASFRHSAHSRFVNFFFFFFKVYSHSVSVCEYLAVALFCPHICSTSPHRTTKENHECAQTCTWTLSSKTEIPLMRRESRDIATTHKSDPNVRQRTCNTTSKVKVMSALARCLPTLQTAMSV